MMDWKTQTKKDLDALKAAWSSSKGPGSSEVKPEFMLEPTTPRYSREHLPWEPKTVDWLSEVAALDAADPWRNGWIDVPEQHPYNTAPEWVAEFGDACVPTAFESSPNAASALDGQASDAAGGSDDSRLLGVLTRAVVLFSAVVLGCVAPSNDHHSGNSLPPSLRQGPSAGAVHFCFAAGNRSGAHRKKGESSVDLQIHQQASVGRYGRLDKIGIYCGLVTRVRRHSLRLVQEHGNGVHGCGHEVVAGLPQLPDAGRRRGPRRVHHDALQCEQGQVVRPRRAAMLKLLGGRGHAGHAADAGAAAGVYCIQGYGRQAVFPGGACRATCDAHTSGGSQIHVVDNPISMFSGFSTKLVAAAYGGLVILAFFWNKWKKQ
ncbi:hypothetical protein ON010_g12937 [Phytophthora cinnamomi]|nr:hypothetical protein ON010_g12937 [Phytophthora cinnamomi]